MDEFKQNLEENLKTLSEIIAAVARSTHPGNTAAQIALANTINTLALSAIKEEG